MPTPEKQTLEDWCKEFCPALPARFENVIVEWKLTPGQVDAVRNILLEHVRQSVAT